MSDIDTTAILDHLEGIELDFPADELPTLFYVVVDSLVQMGFEGDLLPLAGAIIEDLVAHDHVPVYYYQAVSAYEGVHGTGAVENLFDSLR